MLQMVVVLMAMGVAAADVRRRGCRRRRGMGSAAGPVHAIGPAIRARHHAAAAATTATTPATYAAGVAYTERRCRAAATALVEMQVVVRANRRDATGKRSTTTSRGPARGQHGRRHGSRYSSMWAHRAASHA